MRRGWLIILAAVAAVVLLAGSCSVGVLIGLSGSTGGTLSLYGGKAVAVVPVVGQIAADEGDGILGGGGATSRRVRRDLRQAAGDPGVGAIVLLVDSPGGGVTPSEEIHAEILRLKERTHKPVVVSMASLAASGGYYISAPADRIVANRTTLTGSIGVITIIPNLQDLLEKIGVRPQVFKSGPHKDLGTGLRPLTEADERIWQGIVDDAYQRFVEVVAQGRSLPIERVRELADGRIYTATQAKGLGLVDELGDLEDAVNVAAGLAGLPTPPRVIDYRRERGVVSRLFQSVGRPSTEETLIRALGIERQRSLQYLWVEP